MRDRPDRTGPVYDHPGGKELFRVLADAGTPEAALGRISEAAEVFEPVLRDILRIGDELASPEDNGSSAAASPPKDHEFTIARP
jgi:hypothetical protein